ncbi:MAG: TonB family protein [Gammaproteobacteria bacterium]
MKPTTVTALWLAIVLAGCASAPPKPYWENDQWINAMAKTIKSNVHYPKKEAAQRGDPAGQAIVRFTYAAGAITDVTIVKSTGHQILDTAIAVQMPEIKLPPAAGLDTELPHRFQIPVDMVPSDRDVFFMELSEDIRKHVHYPYTSIAHGDQGIVIAHFRYRNGNILNSRIIQSSGSPALDKTVIDALSQLKAPPPPPWARDKTLSFNVPIVFCSWKKPCITLVSRYVPHDMTGTAATELCSEVGFDYKENKISNVHLIHSSGNADINKDALSRISKGDFLPPPENMKDKDMNFAIPVCYNGK